MCLIALHTKPREDSLSAEQFAEAYHSNPHGVGILGYYAGEADVTKCMNLHEAWDTYCDVLESSDGPVMVHFRFATSGEISPACTHPFKTKGAPVWLAHNGVLGDGTRELSDTQLFVRTALWKRSERQLMSESMRKQMEPLIEGSRMVLMAPGGRYRIWNEHRGHWIGSTWFSNDQCLAFGDDALTEIELADWRHWKLITRSK